MLELKVLVAVNGDLLKLNSMEGVRESCPEPGGNDLEREIAGSEDCRPIYANFLQ